MSDFVVIEFKKPIINNNDLKLKTYSVEGNILVELLHSKLLVHPSIVYDLQNKTLNIDLAPFIKVEDDETLMVYSIALEDISIEPPPITCNVCKYIVLDPASIIALDRAMGKPIKVFRVVPCTGVKIFDMLNHNFYTKALHPQRTHVLYLTDEGVLGKIIATNSEAYVEEVLQCTKFIVREYKNYTLSLCFSSDKNYAVLSNNVYGFNIELPNPIHFNDIDGFGEVYGYLLNNLCFIKLGRKSYSCKLRSISPAEICCEVENIHPLAFLSDDVILAVEPNNSLFLLDLNRGRINVLTKISPRKLLNHFIDFKHKYIALTYNDSIFIYYAEDKSVYTKIKVGNALASILANDKLLVFRRDYIDLYGVDVSPHHIYVEKLFSAPKYVTSCVTLEENNVLCMDRKGRFLITQVDKLFETLPTVRILRSSLGITMYSYGDLTHLLINPIYEDSLFRVNSSGFFLHLDNFNNFNEVFLYNIKPKDAPFNSTLDEIPRDLENLKILLLGEKHLILGSSTKQYLDNTMLKVFDYGYSKSRCTTLPKDKEQNNFDNVIGSAKVYIVKTSEFIEWGVSIDESNIEFLDTDKILSYNKGILCLASENLKSLPAPHNELSLVALCSNTIMKGSCIDMNSCEKLLKVFLEVGGTGLSLPIQSLTKPITVFRDDDNKVIVTFNQGVQYVVLPRRCVELVYASLDMLHSIVTLKITNKCNNIGGTIVVENNVSFVEPNGEKEIKMHVDLNHILSDGGLQILILESNGSIRQYTLPTNLKNVIPRAVNIALKIAKVVGIKSSAVKVSNRIF
ncbi:MAG: hypothetical protein QXZ41_04445 [Ignisphaera sp.]|uniref:Uncharacterized protein n=1 Tax=Ignisphaera aggregans TaxID=334771 RepID=A0A7C4NMV9_9CREN